MTKERRREAGKPVFRDFRPIPERASLHPCSQGGSFNAHDAQRTEPADARTDAVKSRAPAVSPNLEWRK
jgi:hypothetical protein